MRNLVISCNSHRGVHGTAAFCLVACGMAATWGNGLKRPWNTHDKSWEERIQARPPFPLSRSSARIITEQLPLLLLPASKQDLNSLPGNSHHFSHSYLVSHYGFLLYE